MLRKFYRDEQGTVMVMIGLTFLAMVGISAASIDYARGSLLKSELVSALDSAALAGGAVANSSSMEAMVNKYYNVNFPAGYMGSTTQPLSINLATDKTTLTIGASASMRNALMPVVGWNTTNIAASTEVTMERKGMEIVLVLDNTGSMEDSAGGGTTKIGALKTASTDLVNILYGNKDTRDNLWVGLVPFSQAVNIGTGKTSWTVTGSQNWGPTTWGGCVEAREASNRDVTDDPPSTALFPKYYSACAPFTYTWSNSWYGTNTSGTRYTNCNTGSTMKYRTPFSMDLGPNNFCTKPLTQMVSSKTTILNAIQQMDTGGDTHINLGLVWGWRMLSPRWRNSWGGQMNTDKLPLDYNTPLMNKVVILLSDGDNQITPTNYTGYGTLANGRLGSTNQGTAVTSLNTRTQTVCNSMKSNNVLIYSVALGSSISSTGKTLLKNCASKPEYYFESPTGADLQTAFKTIGDSLSNLRISK